jgi:hypothetical protein
MLPLVAAEYHGNVKSGGFPLPGATVMAIQGDRKVVAASDQQGAYSFADLPDGTWQLQAEKPGFTTAKQDITQGSGLPGAEIELKMLPLDQIDAVAAPAVVVGPTSVVGPQTTPQTTTATPASAPAPASVATARPPASGKTATAKPATPAATAFQRTDLNATANAPVTPDMPAPEVTNELAQRAADGNLINGSAQNAATSPFAQNPAFGNNRRAGPKLYTYSLALNDTNSALNAAPFSLTGQNTPKTPFNNLTATASVQGPLRIPHLLERSGPNIFLTYTISRGRNASVNPALMPDAAERTGDFSEQTYQGKPVQIYDPASGEPFAGNAIPASRISLQALSLLQYYPAPNFTGSTTLNYQVPLISNQHMDNFQTRVNKSFRRGAKTHTINALVAMSPAHSDTTNEFNFLDLTHSLGINSNVSYFRTYTPRFSGTVSLGFSRNSNQTVPFFSNRENISGAAGIAGNDQQPLYWGPPSLSFTSGIAGLSDGSPSISHNQTASLGYNALWVHKQHTMTFLGDFRWQQFNSISQQNPRGNFTFNGTSTAETVNGSVVPGTGYDFAGFLLGIPDSSAIAFGNADKYFRATQPDLAINDDWRVSPGFTARIGLRWEYTSPVTEKYNRLVNLDIAPGFTAIAPVLASDPTGTLTGQNYPDSLVRPYKHEYEPNVGVAWRPFPTKTMLFRAGYSLRYNTQVYQQFATAMAQQAPLSTSLSVTNSAADPLTLANGFYAPPNVLTNNFAVDPNFRVGYAQVWNFSVQRDLPGSLQMIATYTGTKGTHLLQAFAPNTYPEGGADPCPSCPSGYRYYTSNGNSTRGAGTMDLRRRMHNGFTTEVVYTYSKSIDDASALGGGSLGSLAQNWLDLEEERGPSSFDQRHNVRITSTYTTGMGMSGGTLLSGWPGRLIKGWTINNGINAGTGLPLTPVYPEIVQGGIGNSVRADYTGESLYDAPPGYLLNPAAISAPAAGQWGNAGRDSMRGPFQFSMNGQMQRAFRIRDRFNLQLNITANNPLNHPMITNVYTTLNPQFGLPSAVGAMRSVTTYLRLTF